MRATILFLALLVSGCKTAEFALTHPGTGMHLVARVEAREQAPPKPFYSYPVQEPAEPVVAPARTMVAPPLLESNDQAQRPTT
jgi:hypothetical protein